MTSFTLGIDPGLSGAWALVDEIGCLSACGRFPLVKHGRRKIINSAYLAKILSLNPTPSAAFLEDVHARPGQGVSSMFSFGRSLGVLEGIIAGLGVPVISYLRPKQWQAAMLEGLPRGEKVKESAVQRASLLWPSLVELLEVKAAWGVADAALIAEAGRRMLVETRSQKGNP